MKKYYVTIVIAVIIVILASPLMGVKSVEILGNTGISDGDILEASGYKEGVNIFAFSKARAEKNFKRNTYIKSVDIEKDYWGRKLTFTVTERVLSGYVKFSEGNYLYVDKEGMVLECRTYYSERRPVIEGLEFSEFTVGDYLKVDNEAAFDTMVLLSHLFEQFEIAHDIVSVDLKKQDDIHFYYGNIDILLGDTANLDLKVSAIKEVLPEVEDKKDTGGFLHVQNVDNVYLTLIN